MTPKEKAEYLIDKFIQYTPADEDIEYEYAKECALIAVDEILNSNPHLNYGLVAWWQEVKQEIEKL